MINSRTFTLNVQRRSGPAPQFVCVHWPTSRVSHLPKIVPRVTVFGQHVPATILANVLPFSQAPFHFRQAPPTSSHELPHALLGVDPALQSATERFQMFLRQTFWANNAALVCKSASLGEAEQHTPNMRPARRPVRQRIRGLP